MLDEFRNISILNHFLQNVTCSMWENSQNSGYSYDFLLRWRAALVVLHLATAVSLAGSPSARHSPT